jgi:hypothetical protein
VPRLASNRVADAATLRLGWGDSRVTTGLTDGSARDVLNDQPVTLADGVLELEGVATAPPLAVVGWRRG